jgi:hypothetical protein
VPDAPRLHPPTHRLPEEAPEPRLPDVAAWEPPEAGAEAPREAPPVEADEDLASWEGPFPFPQEEVPPSDVVAPSPRRASEAFESSRLALPGKPTPPLELPLPVLVLTEQARRVPDAERPELALRLNTLLEQMSADGGSRPLADTLHRLLETGKLEGLVDTRGRSCRAVAVEALLSLGFPYALEVRPEDLEHLRAHGRRGVGHGLGPAIPGAVLLTGLMAQVTQELARSGGPDSLVTTQVGLSALALVALWLAPPKSAVYRVGLALLALVTCLGLVAPFVTEGPVGLWAVLGGLVAAFLAALRES